jgi:hypothetical protein
MQLQHVHKAHGSFSVRHVRNNGKSLCTFCVLLLTLAILICALTIAALTYFSVFAPIFPLRSQSKDFPLEIVLPTSVQLPLNVC